MKKPGSAVAFSLVETVVALGIFAFCVVVILALLGVGLRSARGVNHETTANMIASSIFSAWQQQQDKNRALTMPGMITNLPALSGGGSRDLYFDSDGRQTSDMSAAALLMAYSNGMAPGGICYELALQFSWPPSAPSNAIQTRVFKGFIAP
jgi:uncharacterized protein (TIGR02598 family)